jgi:hypothetical protein
VQHKVGKGKRGKKQLGMKREAKVEKVARWKGEMVDAFDRR